MKHKKNLSIIIISILLFLVIFPSMAANAENTVHWQDYNGKRLGVVTGTPLVDAAEEYLPDSELAYYNSYPDCATALLSGKIEGYVVDEPNAKMTHAENPAIDYIPERITENNYSFAFRKDDEKEAALCAELNEFLERCYKDGVIDELEDIWFGVDEDKKIVDMSDLTGENGTIKVATTSTDMPWSYIKDGKNVGYDIDLVVRFCRDRGYALELGDMDFAARIPALQSGKYDFTTDMNVTPEREEQVLFSNPTSSGGMVVAVLSDTLNAIDTTESVSEVETNTSSLTLEDFATARIGVQTGTTFDQIVLESMPDAQISYFNTFPDLITALETDKIDAFPGDEPVIRMAVAENDNLAILKERMDDFDYGIALPKNEKGAKLQSEINEWLDGIKSNGELEALKTKWTDGTEDEKTMPDITSMPAPNGTLRLATEAAYPPMNYYRDNELVGLDIELAYIFCEAYGYGLEVIPMQFDAIIPALQSGKVDLGISGITITEERKESVYFSDSYYRAGTVLAVSKTAIMEHVADAKEDDGGTGFFSSIKSSFYKTFIRENRYQLFVNGILTTLIITVLSVLFGTILGFLVFMLCRNDNVIAISITRFCVWIIQGTPMVVLLMILYYVIFASVSISGTAVAVMGFTLTFGAAVYGLIKMGVGTIDKGQYEAAYALGHSNRNTFFKVILPQAIPHVLPAYKSEIVSLIKSTAIVGYIAVQDLTKMGDIVRSRTYEAFFPLIAVTVIYFVLEGLIGFLISRIPVDSRRRGMSSIMKGVVTDD